MISLVNPMALILTMTGTEPSLCETGKMIKQYILSILAVVVVLLAPPSFAQNLDPANPRADRQILAMGLYPPDLIMRHQQTLGITDVQRKAMLRLVKEFQNEVAELQWELQNKQQIMRQSLGQTRVDAKAVLPEVEAVLALESQFKLAHFKLLIAIKNELTEEQVKMIRQRLREARAARR